MSYTGNIPAAQYTSTVKDTFNGDNSTTDFTLSRPSLANNLEVFVENVQQEPTTAYTVSGTTLSFTSAPVSGTGNIYVIHRGQAVQTVVPPAGISLNATDASITNGLTVDKDGATVATFDRATSDGTIIDIQKDGSSVGSIGTGSGVLNVSGSNSNGIAFGNNKALPSTGNSGAYDNSYDLGVSYSRFKDLYLSGGVFLGGTGSANKLEDYEEGTFTPILSSSGGAVTVGYNAQHGRYVKIGRIVHATVDVQTSGSASTGSGDIYVSNMPFNFKTGDPSLHAGAVGFSNNWGGGRGPTHVSGQDASNYVILRRFNGDTLVNDSVDTSDVASNARVFFQITYEADGG